ncbi:MAG: hypothetical protein SGI89_15250 [bacterium]|nr:hypothetical protein [bacterium]
MIDHIIKPGKKEELIINLPEELLNKTLRITVLEINETNDTIDHEAIKFWNTFNFSSKEFKFNREDVNGR